MHPFDKHSLCKHFIASSHPSVHPCSPKRECMSVISFTLGHDQSVRTGRYGNKCTIQAVWFLRVLRIFKDRIN